MTSSALLITGPTCKFCRKAILASIARHFGTAELGFICPDCLILEGEHQRELGRDLAEQTLHIQNDSDEGGFECAICHSRAAWTHRLVWIDGKQGMICADEKKMTPCERKYIAANREKLSPMAQFALKLR